MQQENLRKLLGMTGVELAGEEGFGAVWTDK